ncbi:hypothetical protein SAMN04487963_2055 [Marinobacter zhejiangensis]|uniref:Uncharacterized protein n=1 Tax=Marinobacter zhejiangensis TaxID=488535 RepID=A0A1I4PXI1_9GAMM|nr:hypothetical protein SAMN04487963_2055 [Marinobacter zhejiangensis]
MFVLALGRLQSLRLDDKSVFIRKIRLFEMVTQLGHNITEDTSFSVSADEDDQVWLTVKQAF